MNLKSLNLKWALAFAGAAVVGVVGVVLVLTLMRGGDDHAAAQPDSATATPLATLPPGTVETTVPPGATEAAATPGLTRPVPTVYPIHVPTLPPSLTLTEKRPCPDKWQRISDVVLNYSICIPPDWGILDGRTGDRLTILVVHDQALKVLSPEGFPYPLSVSLYDSLQDPDMNLIYMALSPVPLGTYIPCDAKPLVSQGPLPTVGCQFRFNYTDQGDADYRPDGTMVEIERVVPLPNPEPGLGGPRTGWGLSIGVVGSEKAMQVHGDTISQILDTVEGQP
jgi:hypothetical protein